MKITTWDPWAFEMGPASEQCLLLFSAPVAQFRTIDAFYAATQTHESYATLRKVPLSPATPFHRFPAYLRLLTELKTHFAIDLPSQTPIHVLWNDWNMCDVVLHYQDHFYRFDWSTTA